MFQEALNHDSVLLFATATCLVNTFTSDNPEDITTGNTRREIRNPTGRRKYDTERIQRFLNYTFTL